MILLTFENNYIEGCLLNFQFNSTKTEFQFKYTFMGLLYYFP